jgi:phosphatidate cytidylyltransferase
MAQLGQWSSHQQRWLTGGLLGGLLLLVLIRGPYWSICLVVWLASLLGSWEFQDLVCRDPLERRWQISYLAIGVVPPTAASLFGPTALHFSLIVVLFGGFLVFLIRSPGDPQVISLLARFAFGWLYISYFLAHAMLLAGLDRGRFWLLWVLLTVFAGDIGAFYGGRRWGKNKLYQQVSPNKTREGAIAGLAASMLIGLLFAVIFLPEIPTYWAALFGPVVGAMGQIGDLVESMLKRLSGKKDASNLLPGHGGFLDRLDSLLFTLPTAWYFHEWLG